MKRILIERGCRWVQDLFNMEQNRWYNYNEFCDKYVKLNVLDYMSLIQTLPKQWSTHLKHLNPDTFVEEHVKSPHLVKIINTDKVCKNVYWSIINYKTSKENYNNEVKWIENVTINIIRGDRNCWKTIYYMPFRATLDSHMRSFQFKLVNRTLITNRHLKLYNIKEQDYCEFCKVQTETYEHLFFECKYVKPLWSKLENWLEPNMSFIQKLNVENIIFGFRYDSTENNLLNFIVLIAKRYIYNCRCKEMKPVFETILLEIKKCYRTEQYLSNFNKRYANRWGIIVGKLNLV